MSKDHPLVRIKTDLVIKRRKRMVKKMSLISLFICNTKEYREWTRRKLIINTNYAKSFEHGAPYIFFYFRMKKKNLGIQISNYYLTIRGRHMDLISIIFG